MRKKILIIEDSKHLRESISDFLKLKKLMTNKTIVMTANNTLKVAVNAMKYGAYDYLEKPVKMDNLLNVIKKAPKPVQK